MLRALIALSAFSLSVCVGTWLVCPIAIEKIGNPEVSEANDWVFYRGQPFTGTLIERFPNGVVFQESNYLNGQRSGPTFEYGFTGAIRAWWHFREGKKDGRQVGWYIEGPRRFEYRYRAGVYHGVQTDWHMSGQIFNQQVYFDGVESARKVFFATSEVFSNYAKKDGRTYGINGGELCFEGKKDGER